ncbi:hypothetical protein [Halovivax sp.]|uniref:hypothetical protein n=1 Tax=Halovivax sp. TaxID=1935978 RepID=UPI0025C5AE40|nr:hypothetical protein [Halovivax sp.]
MTGEPVAVYAVNDGRYLTRWQLDRLLETGAWRRCLRETATDFRLVERADGRLVAIERVSIDALPEWVEIRVDGNRVRVGDVRRTLPPGRSSAALDAPRPGTQR